MNTKTVLIPLKSGQVWNWTTSRVSVRGRVLIPLKSGQVWNWAKARVSAQLWRLNPFEIRAGLERIS